MTQLGLFAEPVKSPICCRVVHCGSRCEVGPSVPHPSGVNTAIRCLTCGATGVISTNTKGRS